MKRIKLVETPCKWHIEDGVKFLVPGCWSRVHNDDAICQCYREIETEIDLNYEDDLVFRVEELERKILELEQKKPLPIKAGV